ncbi:MAG TPA: DUF222 domain-containing protein [Acidimicrobiales bacterium]|nr:DUF222 domain-containing protein [Acidimicrobiales bacterium]
MTDVAKMSNADIMEQAAESSRQMASLAGRIVLLLGELGRREGWRAEGATSLEAWIVERCGVSVPTARAWAHVAERLFDLPHLAAGLSDGELTFDKVRAVVDTATPESDREMKQRARTCSVRELAQLSRSAKGAPASAAQTEYEMRSVRFNDSFRTVTAQLPPESYAEVRATLEARARRIPSDGETRWDQRLCDGLLAMVRGSRAGSTGSYAVVAHVPLDGLLDESSELAGELERGELISGETVRRIACDSTIILAVDDDVGHTMYEGRARRDPTETQRREIVRRDRHCRFPGCTNVTFTNVHHITPWKPDGRTDLDNLALLCDHHHHRVHSREWTMSGNANEELTFVGPSRRVMTSRPSPLWASPLSSRRG